MHPRGPTKGAVLPNGVRARRRNARTRIIGPRSGVAVIAHRPTPAENLVGACTLPPRGLRQRKASRTVIVVVREAHASAVKDAPLVANGAARRLLATARGKALAKGPRRLLPALPPAHTLAAMPVLRLRITVRRMALPRRRAALATRARAFLRVDSSATSTLCRGRRSSAR